MMISCVMEFAIHYIDFVLMYRVLLSEAVPVWRVRNGSDMQTFADAFALFEIYTYFMQDIRLLDKSGWLIILARLSQVHFINFDNVTSSLTKSNYYVLLIN